MAKVKRTMNCGCVVGVDYNDMVTIDYCPKHKVAPDMYKALRQVVDMYECLGTSAFMAGIQQGLPQLKQVLAIAEERQGG